MKILGSVILWSLVSIIFAPAILLAAGTSTEYIFKFAPSFIILVVCTIFSSFTIWWITFMKKQGDILQMKTRKGGFAGIFISLVIEILLIWKGSANVINGNGGKYGPNFWIYAAIVLFVIMFLPIGFWIGSGIARLIHRPIK